MFGCAGPLTGVSGAPILSIYYAHESILNAYERILYAYESIRVTAMSARRRDLLWSPLAVIGLPAASVADAPAHILDPSTGEIDGRVALAIYPRLQENGGYVDYPSPVGFYVHLTDVNDPDVDRVYECGRWFQPPKGFYRIWAEGEWLVSPYSKGLGYVGNPFKGRGMSTVLTVVEAGRVTLTSEHRSPGLSLRLLRATNHTKDHIVLRELTRRTRVEQVEDGLLMPAGPVMAALWDETSQAYEAISRPFEVRHRETVTAPLERPQEVAFLVAQIQRASAARTVDDLGMSPILQVGDRALQPDLKVER